MSANYNAVIFLRLDQFTYEHNQGDAQPTLTIEASDAGIPPDASPEQIRIFGLATRPPAQGHQVGNGLPFDFVRIMAEDTRVYRQPGAGGLTMLVWND
jgi:hypothetical protein